MGTLISTKKNVRMNKPEYTAGKVCRCFARLSVDETRAAEGGLRLQGKYKSGSDEKPLVTFITVVWNNEKTLLRCMESVWNQTYDNIEYIVLDGVSTDGTLDIIRKNEEKIDYYVSQKDNGIYDAMNRALSVASGDIITLLNSDDWAEPDAAEEAVQFFAKEHYDFFGGAGNVRQEDHTLAFVFNPREINYGSIFFGTPMVHQSVYITQACYEKVGKLDCRFKVLADCKYMIDTYIHNMKICRTNKVLSNFVLGGASSDEGAALAERLQLTCDYFPFLTKDEALCLHKELDVTIFWQQLNQNEEKSALSAIMGKHQNQPLLLRAISEAMIFRYAELKNIFHDRSATETKNEESANWLKKVVKSMVGKRWGK